MEWPNCPVYQLIFTHGNNDFDKAIEMCKGIIADIGYLDRILTFEDKSVRDGWATLLESKGIISFRLRDRI